MEISVKNTLEAFSLLGSELGLICQALKEDQAGILSRKAAVNLFNLVKDAPNFNPWFTSDNLLMALGSLSEMLESNKLAEWLTHYSTFSDKPFSGKKTVAVIMAGNIPWVGFHDFLCVLITGHKFLGKLSSQDNKLPVALAELLIDIEPLFSESITFTEEPIKDFDAVIATGSNNSARYFEHYFGKYPHIIRKNRNSLAVINGNESEEELRQLATDVFSYYGLGCRNISKLMVPEAFDISILSEAWGSWKQVSNHHKYFNNYEYFKAIFLVNKTTHTDTGFCLLKKDHAISTPVSVVHYETYSSEEELIKYLLDEASNIQCLAAQNTIGSLRVIPFGQCQKPDLWDYADGVDTIQFLMAIQ